MEESVGLLEIVPYDALGYLVVSMFGTMIIKEIDYVDGCLLVSYINLSRVCKVFNNLIKEQIDRHIINWQLLCRRMRTIPNLSSYVEVDEEHLALMRGEIYYSGYIELVHKELDVFRERHDILYRTKKTGKVYKGYIGITKLQKLKPPKALKNDYHVLISKYKHVKSKTKEMRTKKDVNARKLLMQFVTNANNSILIKNIQSDQSLIRLGLYQPLGM